MSDATQDVRVPDWLARWAAWAWRLIVIGAAVVGVVWLLSLLWLVVVAVAIAALVGRILSWPFDALCRAGLRRGLALAISVLGFLLVAAGAAVLLGWAIADQVSSLGPTISQGIDDLERWLIEDSPFDLDRVDVDRLRDDLAQFFRSSASGSGSSVLSGAVVAAEVIAATVVGLFVAVFVLKDGDRFTAWLLRQLPTNSRERATRAGRAAWTALGGFLRGAAVLGVVEGIVVGVTMALVGAELAAAAGAITFLAAFVPFVGAIVSGVVAVLLTLATAGVDGAIVVAVVVLVVQQLDNDILAPVVYGRTLALHPAVILLGVLAGGALFGLLGSFLAVPVLAVSFNVVGELRRSPATSPAPP